MQKSPIIAVLALLMFMVQGICLAEEPKFRNPDPKLKPLPPSEEARLVANKLGKPPVLSKKEFKEIAQGEVVIHLVSEEGDKKCYEAYGAIDARPDEVMRFMKNYPAKLGIFPHIEKISPSWNANLATVDITIKVVLTTISYRMHFLHYGDHFIEFEFVQGDVKDTKGFYKFFPYAKGKKTLMVYNVYSDPGIPLPDFIKELLTKSSMPDIFKAIRKGVVLQREGKLPANEALKSAGE